MDRLLPLLLFAVFFYLMMRFGCGAHMVHGRHRRDSHSGTGDEASAKDPVCGMTVPPGQGYTETYHGRRLHFCSRQCLDKFDAEPQRYTA